MTDVQAAYTVEQALNNLQQTEDPSARYYAAWWIGRFRVTEPTAIAALIMALEDETDRSPDGGYPLRRNAAKALGKLTDLTVVPALIQALDCEDYYVREAVVRALGELRAGQAIPALLDLLAGGADAAQLVAGKPHLTQPYEAILEALGSLQAKQAVPQLKPFLEHFAPKVQYAAARALYQLTLVPDYAEQLIQALQGPDLQLRRSAMMDLGATGYLAGASAIAQTFTENSLKLIALRDLWMAHQQRHPPAGLLTAETKQILALMDELL